MGTSCKSIYAIFLSKITDYDLPLMSDYELEKYCYSILRSALSKLSKFDVNDLTYDSSTKSFVNDLTSTEVEVITCQMVVEWIETKIHTTQLINMFAGTKDEKMNSQSAHIKSLMELKQQQRAIIHELTRDCQYRAWVREV